MATEAVSTHAEHVEGKESAELKTIEQEIVSSSKAEELATPKPSIAEILEGTEDKKIHQPAVMEVQKVNDAPLLDVPSADSLPVTEDNDPKPASSVSEPAVKGVEKETDGQAGISNVPEKTVESVENPIEAPLTREPGSEVEINLEQVSEESIIKEKPESVAEETSLEKEPEVLRSEIEKVKNSESAVQEPEIATRLEVSETEPKVENLSEPVGEVEGKSQEQSQNVEVEKKSDELEPKENTEGELVKDEGMSKNKVSDATEPSTITELKKKETPLGPIGEDVSVIPGIPEKAHEEEAQKEKSEPHGIEESAKETPLEETKAEEKSEKIAKDEESAKSATTTREVADSKPVTEITEQPFEEQITSRDVEMVTGEKKEENVIVDVPAVEATKDVEPLIAKTEEGCDSSSTMDIAKMTIEEQNTSEEGEVVPEEKKEEAAKTDTTSVDTNSAVGVPDKPVEEENAPKNVDAGKEKKDEVQNTSEEVEVVPEKKKEEAAKTDTTSVDTNSAVGVPEKPIEEENAPKNVDAGKEKKDEATTSSLIESAKDTVVEGKVGVPNIETTNEPVAEPKELEVEPKIKDISETVVEKINKAAEVAEDTSKSDALNVESRGIDDSKTNEGPSKEELPTKPVQKHSNSIISKMKHSIVKVKKAIIGKSPSSKTITSDVKDDVKVKS